MDLSADVSTRRKHPRRRFSRFVGILISGKYTVCEGAEIGEGGLSVYLPADMPVDQLVVVNLQIPNGGFVSVCAQVKNSRKRKGGQHMVGLLFQNLKFESKREIRAFVSTRAGNEQ